MADLDLGTLPFLVLIVFLHGVLVAAETCLVRARVDRSGKRDSARLQNNRALEVLLQRLENILAFCQIGTTLCVLILGGMGIGAIARLILPGLSGLGITNALVADILALGLGGFFLLGFLTIFGEYLPRGIARRDPEGMAIRMIRTIGILGAFLSPVAGFMRIVAGPMLRVFGVVNSGEGTDLSTEMRGEEDLKLLFDQARRTGRIPEPKLQLLERISDFSGTFVRQVMVPRVEVAYFDRRKALAENLDLAQRTAHSRYPLVDGSLDRVVGVVHMKDLFWTITDLGTAMPDQDPGTASRRHPAIAGGDVLRNPPSNGADFLTGISRDVLFVPETMRLDSLLREFQTRRVHMAMVVDEFGGVSGLVTFENVIEEIVGEVQDEFDMEQPLIRKTGDRDFILDGITPLDVANEVLGLHLSSEEADTIGGLLSSELGRLPVTGETVKLDGVEFIVREVRRLRVQRVLARLPAEESAAVIPE